MILLVYLDLYILIHNDLHILDIYIYIYTYYIYIYICIYIHLFIYLFIYLFINFFHVGIVKTSQKSDEAKVEQWIKKILKNIPGREGRSRKKAKDGK